MLLKKLKLNKIAMTVALAAAATTAQAGYKIKLTDKDSIEFGGYLKADARYVTGEVGYRDFWIGQGTPVADSSQFKIHAKETRFNTKYTHGDVMAFIEMDFYGGGGNEIISNSSHPRIRHAFVKYDKWLMGQTWSTFMNTSAIAETVDFAGATMGLVFNRQGQIRYTNGGLQLSIENPETWGTDIHGDAASTANDKIPDIVGKYTFKGDWGNVSVGAVFQKVDSEVSNETGIGYSVAGRIKTVGKDDLRFQLHMGQTGRYVGVVASQGLVNGEYEDQTAFTVAYRHFWNEGDRSTIYYGSVDTDLSNKNRSQFGVNYFKALTNKLSVGMEYGRFTQDDDGAEEVSSDYLQISAVFKF
ncbi:porin [Psychrobium sp. MM17-31]|uniref:DcaP family trimeric outer membrane transporter n=1 Tax=Psychrobium sp. MM17-31 TaxID=2917758 RepID=UPI001EF3E9F7|nr:porin [Psychrobium sp. MM17-31]